MGNVMQTIIGPSTDVWGSLEGESQDQALDVYERILGGYSDETLDAAFIDVASKWEPRYKQPWPAPAAFKAACDRALKLVPNKPKAPEAPWVEDTADAKARVDAMAKQLVANLRVIEAQSGGSPHKTTPDNPDGTPKVWKGRTYFGVTREDFEGRFSTVFGCRWHSPTLAEVIAMQDAQKKKDDEGTD